MVDRQGEDEVLCDREDLNCGRDNHALAINYVGCFSYFILRFLYAVSRQIGVKYYSLWYL